MVVINSDHAFVFSRLISTLRSLRLVLYVDPRRSMASSGRHFFLARCQSLRAQMHSRLNATADSFHQYACFLGFLGPMRGAAASQTSAMVSSSHAANLLASDQTSILEPGSPSHTIALKNTSLSSSTGSISAEWFCQRRNRAVSPPHRRI